MLSTITYLEFAKADGTAGSIGVVKFPLVIENGALQNPFTPFTENTVIGQNGTTVQYDRTFLAFNGSGSIAGAFADPAALGALLNCIMGPSTPTAEGTVYKHTTSGCSAAWPILIGERYSTAATSTAQMVKAKVSSLTITANRMDNKGTGGFLTLGVGYNYASANYGVANPTLTLPDIAHALRFSNATNYVTVAEFTPAGGALTDLTPYLTTTTVEITRGLTNQNSTISTHPVAGIPDEAAYADIKVSGDLLCGQSNPNQPDSKFLAFLYGAASGTLPGTPATPVTGTLHLKFLGGVTTDVSKYHTLDISGTVQFGGTWNPSGNTFSMSCGFTSYPTIYVINEVASYAQPT